MGGTPRETPEGQEAVQCLYFHGSPTARVFLGTALFSPGSEGLTLSRGWSVVEEKIGLTVPPRTTGLTRAGLSREVISRERWMFICLIRTSPQTPKTHQIHLNQRAIEVSEKSCRPKQHGGVGRWTFLLRTVLLPGFPPSTSIRIK